MNNEALNQFVSFMTETLKQAKDFTLEQAPEVMKEVVRLGIAKNCAGLFVCLFGLVIAYRMHLFTQKKMNEDKYGTWELIYIAIAIIGAFGVVGVMCTGESALTAAVAPRVYLIEYFSHLVKVCK